MGLYFVLVGIAGLVVSTASPTNYRGDWLDPRWWARALAVFLIVGGIVFIITPGRGRGR